MPANTEKWKSIKVEAVTLSVIKEIADNEGLSIKDCVRKLAEYFIKNNLSFSQEIDSDFLKELEKIKSTSDKGVDRIIKILRSMERDFIIPINNDVIKITSQLNGIINRINDKSESDELIEESNLKTEANSKILDDSGQMIIAKYKRTTSNALDLMEQLLSNATRARDSAPYVISLNAEQFKSYKEFCNDVRNDLSK